MITHAVRNIPGADKLVSTWKENRNGVTKQVPEDLFKDHVRFDVQPKDPQ